ncbi:50S ribosomal protein L25 [Haemophilus influenzae]|nr:50S ribosomal protein L25 [Haemophilus influenzae]
MIGKVITDKKVRLVGIFGQSRLLDLPTNEPLPRIC